MKKLLKWLTENIEFVLMAVQAFMAFILFIHIDSRIADVAKLNWMFWAGGLTHTAGFIFHLIRVIKKTNS